MARSHTGWSQKWIAAAGVAVIAVLALFFRGEAQEAHQHRSSDHPQEANLPPHGALAKPATHRDFSQNESSSLLLALEALDYDKALALCEQNEVRKTETVYGVPILNWLAQFVGQSDEKLDPFLLCLIKGGVDTSSQLIGKPPAHMPPALAAYRTIPMLLSAVTERNEALVKALVEQGADLLKSYVIPGGRDVFVLWVPLTFPIMGAQVPTMPQAV
jgi:hypothetical protein